MSNMEGKGTEIWSDVEQLFMGSRNYKTVKEQFPFVFNQEERSTMSDGKGKTLVGSGKRIS